MTFDPSQPRVPAGESGGGRWGKPRDSKAAVAQRDVKGTKVADEFARLPREQQAAFLKALSSEDLQKLTRVVYSSRTSDPKVVQMRLAVAAEMGKRGFAIQDFGALGGGLPPKKPAGKDAVDERLRAAQVRRRSRRRATRRKTAAPRAK